MALPKKRWAPVAVKIFYKYDVEGLVLSFLWDLKEPSNRLKIKEISDLNCVDLCGIF